MNKIEQIENLQKEWEAKLPKVYKSGCLRDSGYHEGGVYTLGLALAILKEPSNKANTTDASHCRNCGGQLNVVACSCDRPLVNKDRTNEKPSNHGNTTDASFWRCKYCQKQNDLSVNECVWCGELR